MTMDDGKEKGIKGLVLLSFQPGAHSSLHSNFLVSWLGFLLGFVWC